MPIQKLSPLAPGGWSLPHMSPSLHIRLKNKVFSVGCGERSEPHHSRQMRFVPHHILRNVQKHRPVSPGGERVREREFLDSDYRFPEKDSGVGRQSLADERKTSAKIILLRAIAK